MPKLTLPALTRQADNLKLRVWPQYETDEKGRSKAVYKIGNQRGEVLCTAKSTEGVMCFLAGVRYGSEVEL